MALHLLPVIPLAAVTALPGGLPMQEDAPQLRAVLFQSPACPRCRTVLARVIPPPEALPPRWIPGPASSTFHA